MAKQQEGRARLVGSLLAGTVAIAANTALLALLYPRLRAAPHSI